MSEILCNDCLDTGWIGDREGRSVCACIAETEPYQQLQAEVERLRKAVEDWHDAAVRAERNAAMSQEETIKLMEKNAALNEINEAIKRTTKSWLKDAERYRWLRSHGLDRSNGFYHISWYQQYDDDDYPCSDDEIDAAIDAAREGE